METKVIKARDGKEYRVAHLMGSYYELDGKNYGPESYLIMGPDDKYARALTPKEYEAQFKISP